MNCTVIDIPGITINLAKYTLEGSTDTCNVIVFKDTTGKEVRITICFGKITEVK